MSNFLHLKDHFGNDLYFGDTGQIRIAALPNVNKTTLRTISDFTLREDDVIVVGYPKSGNNWVHHMVTMLKAGTTKLPSLYGKDTKSIFLEGGDENHQLLTADKPRVLFSHLPFRFLPQDVVKKKVKIVYISRNPKDVFVSLYCHLNQTKLPIGYEGTWSQFFPFMLEQGYWYGDAFDYLMDWQSQMETNAQHPIYHSNFEESKRDTLGQVERLNQFLDTGRSRQLCQKIVTTCRLENMHVTRAMDDDLFHTMFLWKEHTSPSSFFRKGVVGDWKNWFTVAQNEQFDKVYKTKMADFKYSFQYE
ncbi:hypothetical protein ACOMHN_012457 [Nucella lapillus]